MYHDSRDKVLFYFSRKSLGDMIEVFKRFSDLWGGATMSATFRAQPTSGRSQNVIETREGDYETFAPNVRNKSGVVHQKSELISGEKRSGIRSEILHFSIAKIVVFSKISSNLKSHRYCGMEARTFSIHYIK